jgi:hypothetical protein
MRPTRAYRLPGRGALASFGRLNVNGVPTVLGVLGAVVGGIPAAAGGLAVYLTLLALALPLGLRDAWAYVRAL